jgi:hypothetical protein
MKAVANAANKNAAFCAAYDYSLMNKTPKQFGPQWQDIVQLACVA